MESTRGIGAMARESGLTVSALRFYDGADVIVPAHVDPRTGYRFYAPEQVAVARLVAALRRVGMPLTRIRQVLAHRADPAAVDVLLAAHLRRLERGLADARRELSSVPALLFPEEPVMSRTTVTVPAAALAAAVRSVGFAVDPAPPTPVLGGVLLDVAATGLTVVATDRYRLAVASVPVIRLDGPATTAVVPAAFAAVLGASGGGLGASGGNEVELVVDGATITAGSASATLIDEPYPDYARLLPTGVDRMTEDAALGGVRAEVGADELRAAVAAGGTRSVRREDGVDTAVTVLAIGADGRLSVGADLDGVGVNAEFLLQAVAAGGSEQLVLHLDDLLNPILIRPVAADTFSLLMPVRL